MISAQVQARTIMKEKGDEWSLSITKNVTTTLEKVWMKATGALVLVYLNRANTISSTYML